MSLSALMRLSAAMLAAGAQEPSSATVVFTGVSLVFLILLILIVVILVQGKIFTSLDKKKQDKESGQQAAVPAAAPVQAAAPAAAPAVEEGIPPEIVAAIVAAVNASTDGAYTLRAVTTAKRGRGSWGLAGVIQTTEPF